jgi:hypothetical protein
MADNKRSLGNLIREPLVIFVVISVLIFVTDMLRSDPLEESFESTQAGFGGTNLAQIEIEPVLVSALQEEFTWLQGREPNAEETESLIAEWLDQEITFRHTLVTEQHLNDGKVREHMIEKISLLWAGLPDDPTDVQVLQHYMDNIDFYYSEPKASFVHVYFDELPEDSTNIAARLNAGEDIAGDVYWLGNTMEGYAESILKTTFGGEFYQRLVDAPLNSWIGPLTSLRGFHYVTVSDVSPALPLKFEDVFARVRQSWMGAQQRRLISEQVELLRPQFTVVREDVVDGKE